VFLSSSADVIALGIIDDKPREEFTPRQRHTLKEFAVCVMLFIQTVLSDPLLGDCYTGNGVVEGQGLTEFLSLACYSYDSPSVHPT
jgi:hypothetical protein